MLASRSIMIVNKRQSEHKTQSFLVMTKSKIISYSA